MSNYYSKRKQLSPLFYIISIITIAVIIGGAFFFNISQQKNNLTFDGNGYKNDDEFLLGIVINDHDGAYITFNDKIFVKENYKQLINNIFKN